MSEAIVSGNHKYLRFHLAGENYAFDVLKAREVLFWVNITPLPTSLDYLAGVINLRGSVIPIVDLRKKFNFTVSERSNDTSIIIVEIEARGETSLIGALVDGVKDVMHCEASELEAPPRFGMQMKASLIKAIAKKDGQFVVILDAEQVFSEDELLMVNQDIHKGPEAHGKDEKGPVSTETL